MPGSSLPSRNSRLAPPPVEMWPKAASSKPRVRTAAAESPPPTTERPPAAETSVRACATARVPSANALGLEDPHRAVPEDGARAPYRVGEGSGGVGTDVEPEAVGGDRVGGHDPRLRLAVPRRERRVDHDVGREHDPDPGLLGPGEVVAAGLDLVLLEQAAADLVALRLEEGEDHAAADQQRVRLGEQVVDDAELVGHLRAAEDDHVRTLRLVGQPVQHVELGLHQAAHRRGQLEGDVVDRGLLAVDDPEAVADEGVGQLGELAGEGAPDLVLLAGLAGVEADVLQHRHLAVVETGHGLGGALPHGVGRERDLAAQQLTEAPGHRLQGVRRVGFALRATEVRGHDHPGAGVGQPPDGRDAGPDPAVVGDPGAVERDVEVGPDEHPLAVQVAELLDQRVDAGHTRAHQPGHVRAWRRRGRSGRRGGWSSPTRCRTSRRP